MKLDDSYKKKEEQLRKIFFKEPGPPSPDKDKQNSPSGPKDPALLNKNISLLNDPHSYLKLTEEVLSDDLFEQKQS